MAATLSNRNSLHLPGISDRRRASMSSPVLSDGFFVDSHCAAICHTAYLHAQREKFLEELQSSIAKASAARRLSWRLLTRLVMREIRLPSFGGSGADTGQGSGESAGASSTNDIGTQLDQDPLQELRGDRSNSLDDAGETKPRHQPCGIPLALNDKKAATSLEKILARDFRARRKYKTQLKASKDKAAVLEDSCRSTQERLDRANATIQGLREHMPEDEATKFCTDMEATTAIRVEPSSSASSSVPINPTDNSAQAQKLESSPSHESIALFENQTSDLQDQLTHAEQTILIREKEAADLAAAQEAQKAEIAWLKSAVRAREQELADARADAAAEAKFRALELDGLRAAARAHQAQQATAAAAREADARALGAAEEALRGARDRIAALERRVDREERAAGELARRLERGEADGREREERLRGAVAEARWWQEQMKLAIGAGGFWAASAADGGDAERSTVAATASPPRTPLGAGHGEEYGRASPAVQLRPLRRASGPLLTTPGAGASNGATATASRSMSLGAATATAYLAGASAAGAGAGTESSLHGTLAERERALARIHAQFRELQHRASEADKRAAGLAARVARRDARIALLEGATDVQPDDDDIDDAAVMSVKRTRERADRAGAAQQRGRGRPDKAVEEHGLMTPPPDSPPRPRAASPARTERSEEASHHARVASSSSQRSFFGGAARKRDSIGAAGKGLLARLKGSRRSVSYS